MEPASPTLPDKNQLTAKVSRVPKVRQLIALRTDRECVSPPRNKITLGLSNRSNSFNHITAVAALTAPRPDERDLCLAQVPLTPVCRPPVTTCAPFKCKYRPAQTLTPGHPCQQLR
jgi:hypothetical protein